MPYFKITKAGEKDGGKTLHSRTHEPLAPAVFHSFVYKPHPELGSLKIDGYYIKEDASWFRQQVDFSKHPPTYEYTKIKVPKIKEERIRAIAGDEPMAKLANKFLVGCDPEFVAIDSSGAVVNVEGHGIPHAGVAGYDHGGRVVEIRPKPFRGTYSLVKAMRDILLENQNLKKIEKFSWRGGATYRPPGGSRNETLGGHVHLDVNPYGAKSEVTVKALDLLTEKLEHLDILPREDCISRRRGGLYGKFGDMRPQQNRDGSKQHMEYRTMASWLFSPRVAYLCLTAAKLAAVSPDTVMDTFKRNSHSFDEISKFFETFAPKDINAARAVEKLIAKGHKFVTAYPDANIRESWKELDF